MITNALLDVLLAFLSTVRGWLPAWDWQLPTGVVEGIKYELSRWDAILPIHEVFQIVSLSFALYAAFIAYRAIKWIAEQIISVLP